MQPLLKPCYICSIFKGKHATVNAFEKDNYLAQSTQKNLNAIPEKDSCSNVTTLQTPQLLSTRVPNRYPKFKCINPRQNNNKNNP